jgi:hypothetical protein
LLTHYGSIEIAENFKNQGNEAYGRGRPGYADAIKFYTQALDVECEDKKLNEACYANRAAVNLELRKLDISYSNIVIRRLIDALAETRKLWQGIERLCQMSRS